MLQGEPTLDPVTKKLRDRVWLSLGPQTANAAGMRMDQLQQFTLGGYSPTPEQLAALARYFSCCGHG